MRRPAFPDALALGNRDQIEGFLGPSLNKWNCLPDRSFPSLWGDGTPAAISAWLKVHQAFRTPSDPARIERAGVFDQAVLSLLPTCFASFRFALNMLGRKQNALVGTSEPKTGCGFASSFRTVLRDRNLNTLERIPTFSYGVFPVLSVDAERQCKLFHGP